MNRIILIGSCLLSLAGFAATGPEKLVARVAPNMTDRVVFLQTPRPAGAAEYFELSSDAAGRLIVEGNTPSALTAGFGHFLRHELKAEYFWEGAAQNLPATTATDVPRLSRPVRRTASGRWRVHFNFCTISYSLAFADWKRWERELDILALHGINLPLSVVGLECTWYRTLLKLGWTDEEARRFLVGPPFQAWQWMTNMESENGPTPRSWLDRSEDLGRRIIARELELGMTPLQEGFTGCVPALAEKKFPLAKIVQKKDWFGHAPAPAQLDPLDPLFPVFAKTFYETQRDLFGSHGFYATDPFHEGVPPVKGDVYLEQVGSEIARAIRAFDPKGVACMQSWSLRMPIVRGFPKGSLLVLDISGTRADHFKGYDGVPFVTGRIWNFGGRTHSGGSLVDLAEDPSAAVRKKWPNCVGSGLFPEGIHTSPLYFEMALDQQWCGTGKGARGWLGECLEARYRTDAVTAARCADVLLRSLYSGCPSGGGSILCARPQLEVAKADPNRPLEPPTDERALFSAWRELTALVAAKGTEISPGLNYDLVDVGRAALSGLAYGFYCQVTNALKRGDHVAFEAGVDRFVDLTLDLDAWLSREPLLDFAADLKRAMDCGVVAGERAFYAKNEALLCTQWGPYAHPSFYDYAWREWSGLLRGYYLPRWRLFFDAARKSLADASLCELLKPQHDAWGRPAYRANPLYSQMADFEEAWIVNPDRLDATPVRVLSDTLAETSSALIGKWSRYDTEGLRPVAEGKDRAAESGGRL